MTKEERESAVAGYMIRERLVGGYVLRSCIYVRVVAFSRLLSSMVVSSAGGHKYCSAVYRVTRSGSIFLSGLYAPPSGLYAPPAGD